MSKNKTDVTEEGIVKIEESLSRTEQFLENNQQKILYVIGGIAVLIAIIIGIKKLYLDPLEEEAQSQMFVAEQYFEKDSLKLALNGDGNYPGFLEIIDEYGFTKSANLANYYTAIIYMKQREFEKALEYLDEFDADDQMVETISIGLKGDANAELGKMEEALSYYNKAAENKPNKFITPIYLLKAAIVSEELKDYEGAVKIYEKLKSEYKETREGKQAEKLCARAEGLIKK